MGTLGVAPVAFVPPVAAHAGQRSHVLVDSALGVGVGVVAVGLYLAILRWQGRDDDAPPEDGESRRENGSPGSADDHRSDR